VKSGRDTDFVSGFLFARESELRVKSFALGSEAVRDFLAGRRDSYMFPVRGRWDTHRKMVSGLLSNPLSTMKHRERDWWVLSDGISSIPMKCRYGSVGERIRVREAFAEVAPGKYIYAATDEGEKWKAPMLMPEEASRLFFEVIEIHVERLQKTDSDNWPKLREENPLFWIMELKKL
jgi:hypothetical protein